MKKLILILMMGYINAQHNTHQYPKFLKFFDNWLPEWFVYLLLVLFIAGFIYYSLKSN